MSEVYSDNEIRAELEAGRGATATVRIAYRQMKAFERIASALEDLVALKRPKLLVTGEISALSDEQAELAKAHRTQRAAFKEK